VHAKRRLAAVAVLVSSFVLGLFVAANPAWAASLSFTYKGTFTGTVTSATFTGTWCTGTVTITLVHSGGSTSIQQSAKPYVAGNGGTITYDCAGSRDVIVMNAAGTTVFGTVTLNNTQAPQVPWCAGTDFEGATAAWQSGDGLSVRFKWKKPTLPDPGWPVTVTSTGAAIGTVSKYNTVDGSPGYFWQKFPGLPSTKPAQVTITAPANPAGDPGCSVIVNVKDGTIAGAPSSYGASDPGGTAAGSGTAGEDCGWNVFCLIKAALKWAFVPSSESLQALRDSWAGLTENRIPFAFLGIADGLVDDIVPDIGCVQACWPEWEIQGQEIFPYDGVAATYLRDWRPYLEAGVWVLMIVPIALGIFWNLMPVVGKGGGS
jgi:hypothetical protein